MSQRDGNSGPKANAEMSIPCALIQELVVPRTGPCETCKQNQVYLSNLVMPVIVIVVVAVIVTVVVVVAMAGLI